MHLTLARAVADPDLNLLLVMDALLAEGSVARAARRLRLSPSAMSRALARLRTATGDPLLVRAGRALVPSPRALALRERVGQLVQDSRAVLGPAAAPDLGRLARTFTIRAREGFAATFGPALMARIRAEAPGAILCFAEKVDRDSAPLRDGRADLEVGVVGPAVEVRSELLFCDRYVAVVRRGHVLGRGRPSAAAYAAGWHIQMAHATLAPVDAALASLGLERRAAAIVGSFATAIQLARDSDLVATVPERFTAALHADMHAVPLPLAVPALAVSLLWHPRLDADPVHRWLRAAVIGCVRRPG